VARDLAAGLQISNTRGPAPTSLKQQSNLDRLHFVIYR